MAALANKAVALPFPLVEEEALKDLEMPVKAAVVACSGEVV